MRFRKGVLVFLGDKKSGKSLLLKIIAGEKTVAKGTVKIFGEQPFFFSMKNRNNFSCIKSANSNNYLYRDLSVQDNLQIGRRLFGREYLQNTDTSVEYMLDHFQLFPLKNRGVSLLSEGERRKLSLASMLRTDRLRDREPHDWE